MDPTIPAPRPPEHETPAFDIFAAVRAILGENRPAEWNPPAPAGAVRMHAAAAASLADHHSVAAVASALRLGQGTLVPFELAEPAWQRLAADSIVPYDYDFAQSARTLLADEAARMGAARIYSVRAETCALAATLGQRRPDLRIPATLPPSKQGFAVFDTPIGAYTPREGGPEISIVAASWGPTSLDLGRTIGPGGPVPAQAYEAGAIWITFWSSHPLIHVPTAAVGNAVVFNTAAALEVAPLTWDSEALVPLSGAADGAEPVRSALAREGRWVETVLGLWDAMRLERTTATATEQHWSPPPAPPRKPGAKPARPRRSEVTVVYLRNPAKPASALPALPQTPGASRTQDERAPYGYRFPVGSYVRYQYSKSEGAYVPIEVADHWRGLANEAVKPGTDVYRV